MIVRNVFRQLTVIVIFLFVLPGSIPAQKAIPARIQFKHGSTSGVVQGSLRGRQQMEYVVRIEKGQNLRLRLSSPASGNLIVKVRDPHGTEMSLKRSGKLEWTAVTADSGDFDVWVIRMNDTNGVSSYKLTVAVR
jgi:hypothetical protein